MALTNGLTRRRRRWALAAALSTAQAYAPRLSLNRWASVAALSTAAAYVPRPPNLRNLRTRRSVAVVEMPPPPINWADDALADAPWEPAQALEAPPLSPAIPKQPPVDLRIEATLANATVKQTTISAIIGGGCCGYVAGWCLLSSLVRLGTVAGATTAGLLVVLPPPPLAANTLWFDVDGDPRGTARRTAYLWARACAAFVLVARDSLKRLWQSLWRRYGPALEGVSNQIVTFDFESLQKQTAQVTRDTAKQIIDLGADVDRKFNLGGKLKGAAKTTLDVITPGHDDEWRDDGTPVRPAVSAGEGLKRVRRRVGSAATKARDWMLGKDEVVVQEPPSSMQQLSTALFLMLPAIFVVAVDHRDEVMASWESLSKVAAAAVAAAAIEASNSPMAALSFMAEHGHAPQHFV